MMIKVKVHSSTNSDIERYSFLAITDNGHFTVRLSKSIYGPLFRVCNTHKIERLILKCKKELEERNKTPNEIIATNDYKYLDLFFFLSVSSKIFKEQYCNYFSYFIRQHIEIYNFDFNTFFEAHINRKWLFQSIKNPIKIALREEIKQLFIQISKEEKQEYQTYISKTKAYTPHKHVWDIKYNGKIYNNILFNIPNLQTKHIIYTRQAFLTLIQKIKYSLQTDNSLGTLLEDKKIILLITILSILLFKKELTLCIQKIITVLIKNGELVNMPNVKKKLFGTHKNLTINNIIANNRKGNKASHHYSSTLYADFTQLITSQVEKGYQKQKLLISSINQKHTKNNSLIWKYFYLVNNNIFIKKIDFYDYKNYDLMIEIKEYIKWKISAQTSLNNIIAYFQLFFLDFYQTKYQKSNFSTYDIDESVGKNFALFLMSNQKISKKKNLRVSTRAEIFSTIKVFLDFIVDNQISSKHNLRQLTINPFENIRFKNVEKHKKNFEPLPEEVYWKILEHIDDLDIYVKNIFIILSATGFRWSEVVKLKKDCLYSKNGQIYVKSVELKNYKNNLKKGKDVYRHIPLFDNYVIEAIQTQISIANEINNDSSYIFVKRSKTFQTTSFALLSSKIYHDSINKLINKYKIKTVDGEGWHYTSHQMRVRIGTLMAENGFESEEIASFLNHANTSTVNKAYAFVRSKKMAELNTKFFKDHFNSLISEEYIDLLTKQDREELYIKLSMDYRQMEYGKCIIPLSQGDCGKLQEASSCSSCEYLITSKDYLYKWKLFLYSQEERLDQLIQFYEKENISSEEYTRYIEFQKETTYLNSYKNIITMLENS